MYLQKPKFKFCLFLVDAEKKKINQTICMAESYEIQQDGFIIFYQIAVRNEKNIKVPVLAYPRGKWEACILVDDNNEYPVFSKSSHFSAPQVPIQTTSQPSVQSNPINNSNPSVSTPVVSSESDDFADLDSFNAVPNQNNNNYSNPSVSMGNPAMIPVFLK